MKKCNLDKYNFLGLNKWDKYKGKNVRVLTAESVGRDDLHHSYKINADKRGSGHGRQTALTILDTAPGIDLYSVNLSDKYGTEAIEEMINKYHIDIVFASMAGSEDWIDLPKKYPNTIFIKSAGNNDGKGVSKLTQSKTWINVGGVNLGKRGITSSEYIFDHHAYIDFASFGVLSLRLDRNDNSFCSPESTGTSIACPVLAGLIARVQDFFLVNTGKKLNQDEMYTFLKDNSKMEGLTGNKVGNGVCKLPAPQEIDTSKYIKEDKENEVEDNKNNNTENSNVNDKNEDEDNKHNDIISFSDIDNHWAKNDILSLVEKGIMNGYDDGTFKPNSNITRAEISRVINNLLRFLNN